MLLTEAELCHSQFALVLGPDAVINQRLGVHRRTQGKAVAVRAVGAHRLAEELRRDVEVRGEEGDVWVIRGWDGARCKAAQLRGREAKLVAGLVRRSRKCSHAAIATRAA